MVTIQNPPLSRRYPGQTSAGKKMKRCEIENGGRAESLRTGGARRADRMVLRMELPGAAGAEARS